MAKTVRALVVLSLVLSGTAWAGRASALPAAQLGPTELRLEVDQPNPGEPVRFWWHATDPDPFTVDEDFVLTYGDGNSHLPQPGTPWPYPCGEAVVSPAGLDHRFFTTHRYLAPGTYEIRATISTRQRLCGEPLSDLDAATVVTTITVY